MANNTNPDKIYKEFGVKTGENTSEFFEIGADAKNVFIQNAEHTQYGDADGVVDLQTKLDNFNRSVRNIGSGVATKAYAAAFGLSTQANGQSSHAEGYNTIALGVESHAEGYQTSAEGAHAHSEGEETVASGKNSHAEGYKTEALEEGSHAEGRETHATGVDSHAEGIRTITGKVASLFVDPLHMYTTSGCGAHAEGIGTWALGPASHSEGYGTNTKGNASHAEGYMTSAQGDFSHAEGNYTQALESSSHAEGYFTRVSAVGGHAEGYLTEINDEDIYTLSEIPLLSNDTMIPNGSYSHVEGVGTYANAKVAHAEGYSTQALGNASHAEGYKTVTKGLYSHVEGSNNQEQGSTNHIEGDGNILQGNLNHVEGFSNNVIGDGLHIEGYGNITYLEPQTQVYFANLPLPITAYSGDIIIDNNGVVTLEQEENIDGRLYKYMISAEISIPRIAQSSPSSLEELANSSIWRGSCVIPRDYNSHPYVIFKKDVPLGSGTYVFKIYFQTYPEYGYIGAASFNIKEVQKIQTIPEKQQFDTGSHVQGKYCTAQSNLAHIVGGGSSNDDRKNIHTIDWNGNAEFAGDVVLFGCGGSNPIPLSTLTKGPLIIQESMIGAYSVQGEYGDKILDAIQKNRQILILLTNQGGSPYSLYSPVITYHLPHEANTELSLFYLPDGISPTNLNIKEAQFKVSNPITFNDNLKN